jgi:hypothetical protein
VWGGRKSRNSLNPTLSDHPRRAPPQKAETGRTFDEPTHDLLFEG